MTEDNIKIQFRSWLKEKGIREKTDNGKLSTLYQYTNRINRLCRKLFGSDTTDKWEMLAKNIGSAVIMCHKSYPKEYFFSKDNVEDAVEYFKLIAEICSGTDYLQANLCLVCNKESYLLPSINISQIKGYLEFIKYYWETKADNQDADISLILKSYRLMASNSSEIVEKLSEVLPEDQSISISTVSIHIQYDKDNKSIKPALVQYYKFLESLSDFSFLRLKSSRHNTVKTYFDQVQKAEDRLMQCKVISEVTGKTALQIAPEEGKSYLTKKEVINALNIDFKTLNVLIRKGQISLDENTGLFDKNSVNEYLKAHFHQATDNYPDVDYSNKGNKWWCNRKTAAEIMKKTERTIYTRTRKGHLTYTDYAPQSPRYYKPELEYLATR